MSVGLKIQGKHQVLSEDELKLMFMHANGSPHVGTTSEMGAARMLRLELFDGLLKAYIEARDLARTRGDKLDAIENICRGSNTSYP